MIWTFKNFFEFSGQTKKKVNVSQKKSLANIDYFNYDGIEYVLRFERHPDFYVTVILIPATLMGLLSILSLMLPVECGEKVSLGVTILLAQVVELLVLSEILPPSTANDFPIAGRLVIFLIVLASISVFVCVFVTVVYYTPECKCVPVWIVRVISSRVMGVLFIARLNLKECKAQAVASQTSCLAGKDGNSDNGSESNGLPSITDKVIG